MPMDQWWWLSFADDDGFLGAATVGPSGGFIEAVQLAKRLNINPGGEVVGAGPLDHLPPERFLNCLMSYDDIQAMDRELLGDPEAKPATWDQLEELIEGREDAESPKA